jgi:hypothetical protein
MVDKRIESWLNKWMDGLMYSLLGSDPVL